MIDDEEAERRIAAFGCFVLYACATALSWSVSWRLGVASLLCIAAHSWSNVVRP